MSLTTNNGARFLTVSIDDGHPTDLRTAELLARYGLRATFYIPARNPERAVMSRKDIHGLAEAFEIGGHTLEHRPLTRASLEAVRAELVGCKQWLEEVIARPVTAFCYPQGKHNARVARLVQQAGFLGARTTMFNLTKAPHDPFFWGVSTQAYSHRRLTQVRHALVERNMAGIGHFIRIHRCARDWEQHFRCALDWVEAHGGIAHLYLHSWEIDQLHEWDKLERVFRDASQRRDLVRVTNGELFATWHGQA